MDRCPRPESNQRTRFRKPVLYPLSYGGSRFIVAWPRAAFWMASEGRRRYEPSRLRSAMQSLAQAWIRSTSGSSSLRPSAHAIRTWWTEASIEWSI